MARIAHVELNPSAGRFRISLPSIDARDQELVEGMLRSLGACEFLFAAGREPEGEGEKLALWRKSHPDSCLEEFNALDPEDGGPADGLAWFATLFGDEEGKPVHGDPVFLRLPTQLADHFGATDLAHTSLTQDQFGYPAIGFQLIPARTGDFARVTEANLNERMAVVLDGRIRSMPMLRTKLSEGGVIEGRFNSDEVARLRASVAKVAGPLRVVEAR